jgi:uncharacterized membrane protein
MTVYSAMSLFVLGGMIVDALDRGLADSPGGA